jgi:DnaJ homolog subfamily C member 3
MSKAKQQMEAEDFEGAVRTLKEAKEHHDSQKVNSMMQEAQMLLKRSKQKDYYKILGVPRDADERDIKRTYRKLTKEHHPDKAQARGVPKEEAEKKMAAINEAYETLSDPELRARVDRGDDPNDPAQQQGGQPFHGSPFGHGPGGQQFFFKSGPFGGGGDGTFQFQFPQGFGFP